MARARRRGAVTIVTLAGHLDAPKRAMLQAAGADLTVETFVQPLDAQAQRRQTIPLRLGVLARTHRKITQYINIYFSQNSEYQKRSKNRYLPR